VLVGQRAEPGGAGAEPVADGLGDVLGLAFQGERAFTQLGGLGVGAGDVAATRDAAVEAGVSLTPSLWHRALSRL
jgi:hypothetical protein